MQCTTTESTKSYDELIKSADEIYNKALTLDSKKQYAKAKKMFQKAGNLYVLAYMATNNSKLRDDTYKKYKEAESYFYAMDYREIMEKSR